MEIKIDLPAFTDRAVCMVKGHDFEAWADDPGHLNESAGDYPKPGHVAVRRKCRRCGLVEKSFRQQ